MVLTWILVVCAPRPWLWRYDLGSRPWYTLGSQITILCNIIQIHYGSEELWPRHRFCVCEHCDLDLGDMTSGPCHTLGYRQRQLCEISSRSNMKVRSYGPDTDFGYDCTVTLTLDVWPCVKVITNPLIVDNNFVKYYILSRLNKKVRSYGQDMDFRYMRTMILTLEI